MKNLKTILIITTCVILLCLCIFSLNYFENYESFCYTKIDNKKIQKLYKKSDMKYEYSLTCYKDNGAKKDIKFKVSKELKQDAYLKLELRTFGVHAWEEITYDKLPQKIQTKINK